MGVIYYLIISLNSLSVITGSPKDWALVSLLPASRPAKTYEVFLETDDDALPPLSSIIFDASFLVRVGSVPVKTKVLSLNLSETVTS